MQDSPQSVWFVYQGKPYRFADTPEAQEFLDGLPSRDGIEFVQAPLLFQLLNAPGAPLANWQKIIKEVDAEFTRTSSSAYRAGLLNVFSLVMDAAESIQDEEYLKKFRPARSHHYATLIAQECTIDGYICVEVLYEVTGREIAAGRMTADHKLRKLAEEQITKPNFTKAELLQGAATKALQQSKENALPTVSESHPSMWRRFLTLLRSR